MLGKRGLDEELRERAVLAIGQSARRQAQLIEDLLDVARITSGKLRLDRESRRSARDRSRRGGDSAAHGPGQADRDRRGFRPIVRRGVRRRRPAAADRAEPAVERGQIHARGRHGPHFGARGGRLRRADRERHRQGGSPEFLPWAFEPFRQGDAGAARVHAGLGLGLSIVKTLVEAHKGHVSAHSAGEERGATFTVLLPATTASERSQASARRRQAPMAPAARSDTSLDGLSVLLVDDDDECREVVARSFSAHAPTS